VAVLRIRGRPPNSVEVVTKSAVTRLRRVVLGLEEENHERMSATAYRLNYECVYGESNPDAIWVSRQVCMTFEELLAILIHEALHDTVLVDGEFLSGDEARRPRRGISAFRILRIPVSQPALERTRAPRCTRLLYSAVFSFVRSPLVFTRCSEDAAQCRLPA